MFSFVVLILVYGVFLVCSVAAFIALCLCVFLCELLVHFLYN